MCHGPDLISWLRTVGPKFLMDGVYCPLAQQKISYASLNVTLDEKRPHILKVLVDEKDLPYARIIYFRILTDPGTEVIEGWGWYIEKYPDQRELVDIRKLIVDNVDLFRATFHVISHYEYRDKKVCPNSEISLKSNRWYENYLPERVIGRKFNEGGENPKEYIAKMRRRVSSEHAQAES